MDIPGCQLQARGLTGNSEALGNRNFEKEKKKKNNKHLSWSPFVFAMTGYGMFVGLVFGWEVRERRLFA